MNLKFVENITQTKISGETWLFSSDLLNSWTLESQKKRIDFISNEKNNASITAESLARYKLAHTDIQSLIDSGFLYEPDKLNPKISTEPAYKQMYSLIILHFSNNCNMACKYCFADASTTKSRKQCLTLEDLKKVARILWNSREKLTKNFAVEFNAGDIFLHSELVFKSIEYIKNLFSGTDYKIVFPLQTNGTALSPKKIELLKKHKLSVSISLDGPEEIHNANRVFINGKGTYSKVIKNAKLAQQNGIATGFLSVVTRPEHYRKIFQYLLENHKLIHSFKLNFIYFGGRQNELGEDTDSFYRRMGRAYTEIVDDYVENYYAQNLFSAPFGNLQVYFMNIFYPEKPFMCAANPCGAARNQIVFAYDYGIYPCQEFISEKKLKLVDFRDISNLDEIGDGHKIISMFRNRKHVSRECQQCAYYVFCQSPCVAHKYNYGGSFDSHLPECHYYKEVYKYILNKMLEKSVNFKDLINKLIFK